jgi:uncharacterized protein
MELSTLSDLLDLQEVDLEIDRLLHQRASLPELEEYRVAHEGRKQAEAAADVIRARHRQVGLDLDKAEGELGMIEAKLKESETRLYAGGMNAKETEHKRLEVQSLRGQQETMENKVLILIDAKERVDEELAGAEAETAVFATEEARLGELIGTAWKQIDAQLARKEARKAEMIPGLDPDLLEVYETLRRTKQGVAIGRLENGQCGGCHLQLSPAEQVEAASSDPVRCVHCRRLLVL